MADIQDKLVRNSTVYYSISGSNSSKQGFYKKAQELLEKSLQLLSEIYQGQERPEMSTTMFTIAQVLTRPMTSTRTNSCM